MWLGVFVLPVFYLMFVSEACYFFFVTVHLGAKKPGFSARGKLLALKRCLYPESLCLWDIKNPVSNL
jgi:hypothetical protein